jgi:hypothetical protein
MKYISEPKPAMASTRPNAKGMTNAMQRRFQLDRKSRPDRGNKSCSRLSGHQAGNSHTAQGNYERYLALGRAEALTGDRIAAENYFQHSEHYFRLMATNTN